MFQYVPKLYDKDTINFIDNNLKVCHNNRVSYYTYIFNFTVLFIFTIVVSITLYTLSNYKVSQYEKNDKLLKDQEYVLSKIKYYKDNVKQNKSLITNLPTIPINNLPDL